jgi:hypothetical protein
VDPILDEDKRVVGVKLIPFFTGRRSSTTVVRGSARTAQGEVSDDFHLIASGVNGTVRKQSRTESVVPLCDMPPGQRTASADEDEVEDDEVEDDDA